MTWDGREPDGERDFERWCERHSLDPDDVGSIVEYEQEQAWKRGETFEEYLDGSASAVWP